MIEKSMTLAGSAKNKGIYGMYEKIIDRVLTELDGRFKSLGTFRYVRLLNSPKFTMFNLIFPKDMLQSLIDHLWGKL